MNSRQFSPDQYLNRCVEIEKCVAMIYDLFAKQETGNQRLHLIWQTLAAEERQHVMQIEFLRRISRNFHCGMQRIQQDKIQQMLDQAKRCLEKLYHVAYDPLVSFKVSVSLESWFLDLHSERAIDFEEQQIRELFTSLADDDNRHIDRICDVHGEVFNDRNDLKPERFEDLIDL